jgi:hypothetical protein
MDTTTNPRRLLTFAEIVAIFGLALSCIPSETPGSVTIEVAPSTSGYSPGFPEESSTPYTPQRNSTYRRRY